MHTKPRQYVGNVTAGAATLWEANRAIARARYNAKMWNKHYIPRHYFAAKEDLKLAALCFSRLNWPIPASFYAVSNLLRAE